MISSNFPARQSYALDMVKLNELRPLFICTYVLNDDGLTIPSIVKRPPINEFILSSSDVPSSPISLINEFDKIDYASQLESKIYGDSDIDSL